MSSLICPRCEKPLDGHDEGACARKMSRRFFFGVVGGGLLAAQAAPVIAATVEEPPLLVAPDLKWAADYIFCEGPIAFRTVHQIRQMDGRVYLATWDVHQAKWVERPAHLLRKRGWSK